MKMSQVLKTIDIQKQINDYLQVYNLLGDVGVNTQASGAIQMHIERTLELYNNFETLYDADYSTKWIEYCIIEHLPEMFNVVSKNAITVSKIFSSYKTMCETSNTNATSKNSYEGFNANGTYSKTENFANNYFHNPIRTLLTMDVDFKKVTQNFKKDIEKILQVIY